MASHVSGERTFGVLRVPLRVQPAPQAALHTHRPVGLVGQGVTLDLGVARTQSPRVATAITLAADCLFPPCSSICACTTALPDGICYDTCCRSFASLTLPTINGVEDRPGSENCHPSTLRLN